MIEDRYESKSIGKAAENMRQVAIITARAAASGFPGRILRSSVANPYWLIP